MPTYNGEEYLSESLESILCQSHKLLDVLVVDDGSSDKTVEIVNKYKTYDKRIRLIQNTSRAGMVNNWNKCIQNAHGEWFKLHFQDDLMEKHTIERMLTLAWERGVRIVLTDREYLFEKGVVDFTATLRRLSDEFTDNGVIDESYFRRMLLETRLNQNFIGEPILGLVQKSLIDDIGLYDARLRQIVDLEYWLRIALTEPIGFIPERLHKFRVHLTSQGAKNTAKRVVSVTSVDKILMTAKMLHDGCYRRLRESPDSVEIQQMLSEVAGDEIVKTGLFHIKKEVGNLRLVHLGLTKKQVIRSLFADGINYMKAVLGRV